MAMRPTCFSSVDFPLILGPVTSTTLLPTLLLGSFIASSYQRFTLRENTVIKVGINVHSCSQNYFEF